MKDSDSERVSGLGTSADPGALSRSAILEEVFEIQMGLMFLEQRAMRDILTRFDLQLPHMVVLSSLAGVQPGTGLFAQTHHDQLSMSEISRALGIPPATVTALIDRLVAGRLVERTPSPQDRRLVLVSLTPGGHELCGQIFEHWKQRQLDAFEAISDEQLGDHLALMRRLHHSSLLRSAGSDERPPAAADASPTAASPKDSL
ncbi:MarR family winged helix-turn-helix transcriptional regulator [Deinococcus sp.]|uniref:MarR family winged helix-turn-helix transcriptional regulator n=1 Tax=Deinococcus sp. TaxID=47478 RepID=UPI003CC69BC6